ncbi:hypothetical protein OHA57_14765 [Streptomyces anulatus]|uniref:hypothetical protein n=1 Tax=Streptomyces anulatus TaxID=1892 RepID=UPI002DDC7DD8|nr:hypothetical protein [Streptomyces anulatus]WSC61938.1 hypothetical protein OHA57_14765 [Streptomyces anulatus]
MKWIVTVLAALGGLLPIAAVIWGWRSTRREHGQLVADLDAIDGVGAAPPEGFPNGKSDAMYAIRSPKSNVGRATYTYEWVQRLILEQALADLRGPAWLAGAGIPVGTIASV